MRPTTPCRSLPWRRSMIFGHEPGLGRHGYAPAAARHLLPGILFAKVSRATVCRIQSISQSEALIRDTSWR